MSQGAETAPLSLWVFSTQGWDGRGKGWREAKGGNPGEPAESLESPFFFVRFIPFFSPHLCFVRLSRICPSRRGFWAVSRVPRHGQTDRLPISQRAPSCRALCSAARGSSTGLYTGFGVFFFKENQNSMGKYIF